MSKGKFILIFIIIVCILAAVCFGLYMLKPGDQNQPETISENAQKRSSSISKLDIEDGTASFAEAVKALNWFYENNGSCYQFKLNEDVKNIKLFTNNVGQGITWGNTMLSELDFTFTNGIETRMGFSEAKIEEIEDFLSMLETDTNPLVKDNYKNFNIVHINSSSMYTTACRQIDDNLYFYILVRITDKNDNVDYIKTCKDYIDKVTIRRIDPKLVLGTGYTTKYIEGWNSSKDGSHPYLNKNIIKLDNYLTLNLKGYGLSQVYDPYLIKDSQFNYNYALDMMGEEYIAEEKGYKDFTIAQYNKDEKCEFLEKFIEDVDTSSKEITLNGQKAILYDSSDQYNGRQIIRYDTGDVYYLFIKLYGDDLEEFLDTIIQD